MWDLIPISFYLVAVLLCFYYFTALFHLLLFYFLFYNNNNKVRRRRPTKKTTNYQQYVERDAIYFKMQRKIVLNMFRFIDDKMFRQCIGMAFYNVMEFFISIGALSNISILKPFGKVPFCLRQVNFCCLWMPKRNNKFIKTNI